MGKTEQLAFSSVLVWIASEFVSQLTSRSTEMPKANAQRALGLFGEPSYLGIGDPYDPPKDNAGRHRGVNFTTSPVKKGNVTKYVCFDTTFRRVSEGDTYKMPGANERKSRRKRGKSARPPMVLCFHIPQSVALVWASVQAISIH